MRGVEKKLGSFLEVRRGPGVQTGTIERDYRLNRPEECFYGFEDRFIAFEQNFDRDPEIAVSITGFDVDMDNFSIDVWAYGANITGFHIVMNCGENIKSLKINWVAVVPEVSGITIQQVFVSGMEFKNGELSKTIDFEAEMTRPVGIVNLAGWGTNGKDWNIEVGIREEKDNSVLFEAANEKNNLNFARVYILIYDAKRKEYDHFGTYVSSPAISTSFNERIASITSKVLIWTGFNAIHLRKVDFATIFLNQETIIAPSQIQVQYLQKERNQFYLLESQVIVIHIL